MCGIQEFHTVADHPVKQHWRVQMKQTLRLVGSSLILALGMTGAGAAEDYSALSNEDLVQMRSQVREMPQEDRQVFRSEMQNRVQSMSPEEKRLYQDMNGGGRSQGAADGRGQGRKHGKGEGGGSGKMQRNRQSSSQGYGSGYGSRQGGGSGGGSGGGHGRKGR
jgi:hypothetical protein